MFFALLRIKAGGFDRLLKLRQLRLREIRRGAIFFEQRSAVTMLTRLSVHCAERIVATSNCERIGEIQFAMRVGINLAATRR